MASGALSGRIAPERGAAILEAAVSLVVLVALVLGVTTVARSWGRQTDVDRLAARAARAGARVVDQPASDLEVLELVGAELEGATLERLVLFRPSGPQGLPSPECASQRPSGTTPGGVSGWCSTYGPGHLAALAVTQPATGCVPGSWESAWCPGQRRTGDGSSSWLGVLLDVRHAPTGGWEAGSAPTVVTGRAVVALDPLPEERP